MSRLHKFQLLSKEELDNSPSRADGVPANMEQRRRRLAAQHMRDVSFKFHMSITTWAIAVTFFNRFYARKSMKKNNTFVIAAASLFLAGKVNDEARPHQKLANELLKAWYGKDNPHLIALVQQQRQAAPAAPGAAPPNEFLENMYGAVLEAERALLYTVGFDFNIEIIHTHVARLLKRPRFQKLGLQENKSFQQPLINIANDLYTKDGTLVLQYPADKIALAMYYLVFKAAKANKVATIPQPAAGANGVPWYVEEGLSVAECIEITSRMNDRLYNSSTQQGAAAAQRKATASMPTPSVGQAASTAMLGACESAAYSGGGPTLGGGGGFSELGSGAADALGEHTSVPRPLSSDVGSGSKRPADGPTGGVADSGAPGSPSKRARMAAAAAACEATSAAAPVQQPRVQQPRVQQPRVLPGFAPPAALCTPYDAIATPGDAASAAGTPAMPPPPASRPRPAAAAAAPPAAAPVVAAPMAAVATAAAAAAAAAAADSDKEEGELEEGELS